MINYIDLKPETRDEIRRYKNPQTENLERHQQQRSIEKMEQYRRTHRKKIFCSSTLGSPIPTLRTKSCSASTKERWKKKKTIARIAIVANISKKSKKKKIIRLLKT